MSITFLSGLSTTILGLYETNCAVLQKFPYHSVNVFCSVSRCSTSWTLASVSGLHGHFLHFPPLLPEPII